MIEVSLCILPFYRFAMRGLFNTNVDAVPIAIGRTFYNHKSVCGGTKPRLLQMCCYVLLRSSYFYPVQSLQNSISFLGLSSNSKSSVSAKLNSFAKYVAKFEP